MPKAYSPRAPARRLAACPRTPNCVTTDDGRPEQRMEAIPYRDPKAARARLRMVLRDLPRTRIVEDGLEAGRGGGYLHAEVRSALFHFVDDVEFVFDDPAGRLHFRSASRLGRSDFGVNRRRMEAIRQVFLAGGGP